MTENENGSSNSEGKFQVTGFDQCTKVRLSFPPTLDNHSCTHKTLTFSGECWDKEEVRGRVSSGGDTSERIEENGRRLLLFNEAENTKVSRNYI